jgi:hypothetical protein
MGPVLKLFSTYPFAPLFSTNPTSNGLGLNPGFRDDRPANNPPAMARPLDYVFEYATEKRTYIFWLNFELCEFVVWRTAYDEVLITFGGLRLSGNFEVYVFLGVGDGWDMRSVLCNNETS